MLRFSLDAISSFSHRPLQLATLLGFVISTLAFIAIPVVVVLRILGSYLPGFGAITIAVLLLGGIQLIAIGIIGEYVGRIYDEVKGRPLYLVRSRLNIVDPRRRRPMPLPPVALRANRADAPPSGEPSQPPVGSGPTDAVRLARLAPPARRPAVRRLGRIGRPRRRISSGAPSLRSSAAIRRDRPLIASAIGSGRWTQSASGPSGRRPSTRTGWPGLPTTVEFGGTSWIDDAAGADLRAVADGDRAEQLRARSRS